MNGKPQVAFLGTGIMGAPMCLNISRSGYPVKAWNRTAAKLQALQGTAVELCATPEEAVRSADVVIVMLSTGPVCDEVLFGSPDGRQSLARHMKRHACVIVMSSIPVSVARRQAQRLECLGVRYIDAPVSGGEAGARQASLSIMAGGDPEDIQGVQEILDRMGKVTRIGPVGSGQLCKLANQMIVGITICAVSEALILAQAGGADLAAVRSALMGGFASSAILDQHGPRMINRQFEPGGKAEIQLKDLRTAEQLARELGLELPALALGRQLFTGMCENGKSQIDHSGLYLELLERSGINSRSEQGSV